MLHRKPESKAEDFAVLTALAEVLSHIKATNSRVSKIVDELATTRKDLSRDIHTVRTDLSGYRRDRHHQDGPGAPPRNRQQCPVQAT
jgi:hypothetical protein